MLPGAYILDVERREDARGFFGRTWCVDEFTAHGLNPRVVQCNVSFNALKGTLRGMHFQTAPFDEAKLVRCTMGAIYDVIIDLRPDSPAFLRHVGVELSAQNRRALYIPEGLAHGFQTLTDDAEVFYQMSEVYHPECASGVRWDDPAFGIAWPLPAPILSDKDRQFPDFAPNVTSVAASKTV